MIPYLVRPPRIEALAELVSSWPVVVLDCETTGLQPYLGDRVLGFGLGPLRQEGRPSYYYIPLSHDHPDDKPEWNASDSQIAPIVAAMRGKPIMGWNLKFDLHNLSSLFDFDASQLYDAIVLARIMADEFRPILELETVAYRQCGLQHTVVAPAHKKDRQGRRKHTAEDIGRKCMEDVYFTADIYLYYRKKMEEGPFKERLERLFKREIKLTRTLYEMERRGLLYDVKELDRIGSFLEEQAGELLSGIGEASGLEDFNPRSSPQTIALMKTLKIKPVAYTRKVNEDGKRKTPSWDRNALMEVMNDHPIALQLAQYRSLQHELSNLISLLREHVKAEQPVMHFSYQNWGTVTGRLSAKDPNVQGIAKGWLQMGEAGEDEPLQWSEEGPDKTIALRSLFIPRPGHVFVECDYRQIEMFVAGWYIKDKRFLKLLEEEDFHGATAEWVWGARTPEFRKRAKWFNFGLLYGLGDDALAKKLKCSKEKATIYRGQYFRKVGPGYFKCLNDIRYWLRKNSYVENVYGRRYYLSDELAYMGFNYMVQGSAADFVKFRLEAVKHVCEEVGIHPLLTTHDDMTFEVPENLLDSHHMRRIVELLEDASVPFGMRFPVKVRVGRKNLAEMEEFDVAKVA